MELDLNGPTSAITVHYSDGSKMELSGSETAVRTAGYAVAHALVHVGVWQAIPLGLLA